jgi:hypothetical protein
MSYDFDVRPAPCDHQQAFERYVVDSRDFRTFRLAADTSIGMRAPVNGQSLVKVYIGGTLIQANDPVFGYSFVLDLSRLEDFSPFDTIRRDTADKFHKIVFNKQVRFVIPLLEVSYITLKPYCLKCSGSGQLNDLKKASSGSLIRTLDTNKLVQRSLKYILSSRCPFYPALTCPIKDFIGRKFGVHTTEADISNGIMNALQQFKKVQGAQRTIQVLTPHETLKDITSVTAVQSPLDPTAVNVAVQVSSYAGTTLPLAFSIRTTK